MKECWSEGALRAYLDRELPPEDMARVAEHLEVCSECGDHWTEMAGRAARVSSLLDTLGAPARTVSISRTPRRAGPGRWKWAAAALAAGVLLGMAFLPKRRAFVVATLPPPVQVEAPPAPLVQPVEAQAPRMMDAVARPERPRPARPVKRQLQADRTPDDFVSLDDEPISTGVVLRVELGPRGIPADVIFGPDGRPHAIRLVNNKSNH